MVKHELFKRYSRKRDLVTRTVALTAVMLMSACMYGCQPAEGVETMAPVTSVSETVETQLSQSPIESAVETFSNLSVKSAVVKVSMNEEVKAKDLVIGGNTSDKYKVTFSDGKESLVVSSYKDQPVTLKVTNPDGISYTLNIKLSVQDKEPPVIKITHGRIEVTEGDPIDLMVGVSALDGKDGDLTSAITASAVDVAVLGAEQLIKYSVTDAAGNEATAEATLLIKADPIEVLDKTMYATAAVNVRSGSNKDTDKVSSLSFADSVKVTGKDKNTGWYQIKLSDGKIGYVSDKYLSDKKPSPKPVSKPSNTQTKPSGGSSSQSNKPSGGGSSKTKPSGGSGSSNSSKDSGSQNSDTGSSGTKPLPPIAPAQGGDRTGDGFAGWG